MCDLFATGMGAAGLVYTTASVMAMFRGANILLTALFSFLFLNRTFTRNRTIGLALVLVAMIIIGKAATKEQSSPDQDVLDEKHMLELQRKSNEALFGISLIVGGQVVQAIQYVWEEKVMKDLKLEPFFLVGIEGVFGACAMFFIGFPVLYYIFPGHDVDNSLESFSDSIVMLQNSSQLQKLLTIYVVAIMVLNMLSVTCTKLMTGVVRALVQNGLRTATVWGVDLLLFYVVTDGKYGESWDGKWSLLQAVGFGVYMVGMLLYMEIVGRQQATN